MEYRFLNVEAGSVDDRLSLDKPKKHLVCETLKKMDLCSGDSFRDSHHEYH